MLWILLVYQLISFGASLFLMFKSKSLFWKFVNAFWAATAQVAIVLLLMRLYGGG